MEGKRNQDGGEGMKQIGTIDTCGDCPFLRMLDEVCGHSYTYHMHGTEVLDLGKIPYWCPLEDKND